MLKDKSDELVKDTRKLIIEFIDNCKESFQTLEKLIHLNEEGLMKCFEWSEKSEIKLNGLVNLFDVVNKKQDGNSIKIEKLETHIEKVHDLVNLEDRITACDVLNRLTLLENDCKNYMDQKCEINAAFERIKGLEFHKNLQIDENRKISKRMDELEQNNIKVRHVLELTMERCIRKIPHKCPLCDGIGGTKISGTVDEECNSCNGKGIIWG